MTSNGTASWSNYHADLSYDGNRQANAALSIDFSNVDWSWLKEVYGWSAFQWQGWARGEIYVRNNNLNNVLNLDTENVLEFWIDDVHYFGADFYGYKKARVTLHLEPGVHSLEVRLIRDVRSMGGVARPSLDINLQLRRSWSGLRALGGFDKQIMMSDVIGGDWGQLASPYASITLRNDADRDILIHSIEGMPEVCEIELLSKSPIRIAPGQTRPVAFLIGCVRSVNRRINMHLNYRFEGEDRPYRFYTTMWPRVLKGWEEPHKVTFLHPGGMVSYAILRPPSANISCGREKNLTLPVLIALHGAGLEADSDIVKHALDNLPDLCAWVLFPTGVVPWSGDDWHNWGLADVEAGIAAIPAWIEQVEWNGPGVDINKWLVSGHSNGGQGAWYTLTHRPDKVIAAAVLSAYSSIQNYVPYTFWHTADPGREAMVQSALLPYRHELLLENAKGIPVLQQHGDDDDNVPVYNARLMNQRAFQAEVESSYFEVPGKPHYWDGVLVTPPLKEFFEKQLALNIESENDGGLHLEDFHLVIADPGDMGSRHGVKVLEALVPGRLAVIELHYDLVTGECLFHTRNIRIWQTDTRFSACDRVLINGQKVDVTVYSETGHVFRSGPSGWQAIHYISDKVPDRRSIRQQGAMDALLRSRGAFQIAKHSNGSEDIVLQISRNLCQYFTADTEITEDYKSALNATGNIISVAIGEDLPQDEDSDHPFNVSGSGVSIRQHRGKDACIMYDTHTGNEVFATYLRPLPDDRLELVVWGEDEAALAMAARFVPILTGTGQPDFIVGNREVRRKGVEGTLALGFFDGEWEVSANSFLTVS